LGLCVVLPDRFDRTSIARGALVGDNDSPDRVLLGTNSSKSYTDSHWDAESYTLSAATDLGPRSLGRLAALHPGQLLRIRHVSVGHLFHQGAHLAELFDHVVHLLDLGARTFGDPAAARALDDLRVSPLVRG